MKTRLKTAALLTLIIAGVFLTSNLQAQTEVVSIIREDCDGYSNCYTSLYDWEEGEQRDLTAATGDDTIAVARIEGTWTNPDTTSVTIDGWTTSATNYIKIYTTAEARHEGVWDEGKYRLEVTNNNALVINEGNVRVEGLQIYHTVNSSHSNISINVTNEIQDIQISHNILTSNNDSWANRSGGIGYWSNTGVSGTIKIWNNFIYDHDGASSQSAGIFTYNTTLGTLYIYNNTIQSVYNGIMLISGTPTVIAKNNIIASSTVAAIGTFAAGTDYNATDNASMNYTVTGGGNTNDRTSQTITFQDPTNNNFHLSSSDTSALDQGTDLSSDSNLAITDDIDGDTRPAQGGFDIGADEQGGTSTFCGDGTCNTSETCSSCSTDCGACASDTDDPIITLVNSTPSTTSTVITWTTR